MTTRSRYDGQPTQNTWTGKIIAVFALVLVVAFAVALAKYLRSAENQTTHINFASSERIDDSTMRVWADVSRKDTSVPAYCIVTALDYNMAEVGRREFYVPPGGEETQRFQVDVPTREVGVAGGAYGCGESIPFYLDPAAATP